MKSKLIFKTLNVRDLLPLQKERMFELMADSYSSMDRNVFDRDLGNKQIVGLIMDESDVIQGFTTFSINPKNTGTEAYHILFSGDTIISPDHWGSLVMVKGWCTAIGEVIASDRTKSWYWYLMSKGHRTYMYLPLFFHNYYPSAISEDNDVALKQVIDRVSTILYPENWKPELGVIEFDSAEGALTPDLVQGTYTRKNNAHVAFFLECNPGFYKGDELVCMANLHPDNFKRSAKDYVIQGMNRLISEE
jgi:hypothetical protein